MKSNIFSWYVPVTDLVKSEKGDKSVYTFKGKASDASKDSDGESLKPEVFDFSEFKYVNWDHGKNPEDIIGEQTGWTTDPTGVFVEGLIYNEGKGKSTIDLMKKLQKSPNGNRLGISVEGEVLERDLLTKMPTKAKVTSIALCPFPKNGNTWAELMEKSQKGEVLYQDPKLLEYEEPEDCLLHFTDGEGNHIKILPDFSWKIEKAQTTENSSALKKEDVEGNEKYSSVVTLVKAHQNKQISDDILEKVKEKLRKSF